MTEPSQPKSAEPEPQKTQPRIVEARELFDGSREVLIVHEGETYRLRLTRRNKLILQK